MGGHEREAGATGGAEAATLASAIALHRRGQLGEAAAIYLALLEADPEHADALHFLGVLRHQQGQSLQAMELVRRAIELRPDYVDAISNLGNICHQSGGSADAVRVYQQALELRPGHTETLRNLGIALRKLKRHAEAVEAHLRAIGERPGQLDNYYALASTYREMGQTEEALATLRKALAIKPQTEGFWRLGQMLYGLRRIDEATANFEAWLRFEPDSPVAKHMLAACTGEGVPERAGDAFVTAVFDGFAESFDEVLTGRLEYRAPALVGETLQRICGEPRGDLDIVDAGCGTGLLAQHLRPYARRLVGVDLSTKMLEKALRRSAYDELLAAELGSFLASSPQAFDIVASSDTLVYFGDLREVLAAAGEALRPGGKLVFTLEHAASEEQAPAGYRIHPHGRYSHSEGYVRRTLADAGFEPLEIGPAHLRREGNAYVAGLVVSARRADRPQVAVAQRADPQARLARGAALHRQGQLAQAEAAYRAVLRADENNPEALFALGVMRQQQGRSLAALNYVNRAIELRPTYVEAYVGLGSIYRELGSIAGARQAYERALELRPDHPEALRALAPIQDETRRLEQSAEEHRRKLEQDPANAEHLHALANVYLELGRAEETVRTLAKALSIRPEAAGFRRLGAMLTGMGRLDDAASTYETWLRTEPDHPVAKHMLAACTGRDIPARASDGFVARDFDRFADTFDSVLARLEYHAPALLGEALRRHAAEPRADLVVLDAGCGTGLLAPYLRPWARRLIGVDLSSRMLERAKARGQYDELVADELSAFMRSSPGAFEVIAAADTLNYFGDLSEVMAAARASLRPGGRLVFTLEHAVNEEEAPAGYRLHPDGRYMHSKTYVRRVLSEAGLDLIDIERAHLRREGDAYVAGLVVAARRSSTQ